MANSFKDSKKKKSNPVKSFFYKLFVRNFKYKLLALVVAVVIWLLVAGL